ncbi:hypothetical protein [Streptomyces albireticuli]|uniref:hypothetical protein n=1 Tax=Streptomyces albireticuli TaxID=1940 RepID=UPI001F16783B|nr:hypothetical protein [Streptomyces albireticuli]
MDTTRRTLLRGMAAAPLVAAAGGLLVPSTAEAVGLPASRFTLNRRNAPSFAPRYPYDGALGRLRPYLGEPLPLSTVAARADKKADRVTRWPRSSSHPSRPTRPDVEPERRVPGHAFRWDSADFTGRKWRPQGITQDYDADGRSPAKTLLVSWYDNTGNQGARLSVVNWSTSGEITYRHVLLVEPYSQRDDQGELRDNIAAPDLHAGGIAWYGHHLYLADSMYRAGRPTFPGIRVFDLRQFFKVTKGGGIGRQPDGRTFHAHGYEYVLPQTHAYDWSGRAPKLVISQVSVDRTASGPGLLVSEYDRSGSPRLVRWPFTAAGALRTGAEWAHAVPRGTHTQGAVKVGSTYYLTTSHSSRRPGELRRWKQNWAAGPRHRSSLNIGVEDLTYDGSGSGALWTLGEYANDEGGSDPRAPFSRYVYAVRP